VGGLRRQYSLKVIFISLSVRLQCLAAFGTFQRAVNNISMDFLVSGLISALSVSTGVSLNST